MSLGAGSKKTFRITVRGDGGAVDYILDVTRRHPQLGNTGNDALVVDAAVDTADKTFTNAELQTMSDMKEIKHTVPYEVDMVTLTDTDAASDGRYFEVLEGATDAGTLGDGYFSTSSVVSPADDSPVGPGPDGDITTTGDNTGDPGWQVKLKSGETTTVTIMVKHWLPTEATSPVDPADGSTDATAIGVVKSRRHIG